MITNVQDIASLGTILGVWAHPDDEVFNATGVLTAAVANGQTVVCVTATRGEGGVQNESRWPASLLGDIREKELKNAYKIIGIDKHYWLDYPDGACESSDQTEAVARISELIQKYSPDTIMTFGPDGLTGHADHKTVSAWAEQARQKASSRSIILQVVQTKDQFQAFSDIDKELNFFFNTDKPRLLPPDECSVYMTLTDDLYSCKLEALRAMPSQYEKMFEMFGDSLRPALGIEAFVEAKVAS